jgi:SSS family transporter
MEIIIKMGILAAGKLMGPDYFILIGYFALMLGIGAFFYRFMRNIKDYFSGGNSIPWWLSGISFYMASFSAFGFVGFSALAYKYGWVSITLFWICAAGTITSVTFFSKRWRRARIDSPVEYLETRYSPSLRQIFAWQGLPVRMFDDTFKLIAIGVFISKAFNIEIVTGMVCSGGIMLAYTLMGGLWAVAVTDFIQFIILAMAVIALVPLSINEIGGVSNFINKSPEGFFNLMTADYNIVYMIASILLYMLAYSSVNWALIQRYYCVPKERDTYKLGWLVIFLQLVGPPLMLIPAMAARQFLPGIVDPTDIYPQICLKLLPVGMVGLVVAAMFSATLSTLSGDYNVCSSVLTNDVYRRIIRPNASPKEYVVVGRLMTLLVGFAVITMAILMRGMTGEGLVKNMFKLFSIATAPVAIPMILGLLSKRITNRGVMTGFAGGITVGLGIYIWSLITKTGAVMIMGLDWQVENILLFSTSIVTLVLSLAVSYSHVPTEEESTRAAAFLLKLKTPIGELPEDIASAQAASASGFSPFKIVGVCTLIICALIVCVLPFVEMGLSFGLVASFAVVLFILGSGLIYSNRRKKKQQNIS